MTKRRKLLLAGAGLAAALVVLSLPAVRWPLMGWWRGEPFYDGRPASYWSAAVAPLSSHYKLYGPAPGIECHTPDCLFPELWHRLGMVVPTRRLADDEVPLGQGDPAAVPVLQVLLRGPDERPKSTPPGRSRGSARGRPPRYRSCGNFPAASRGTAWR